MDSFTVEDEKKPFDSEVAKDEDDLLPDPDEQLYIGGGPLGRIWLVKLPKYLLERWSKVEQANQHLATVRVYSEDVNPKTGQKPRIFLILPSDDQNSTEYDSYELDMVNEAVTNQYVIAEKPKEEPTAPTPLFNAPRPGGSRSGTPGGSQPGSSHAAYRGGPHRARSTILAGAIRHECNVRPFMTPAYRARMRARNAQANTPARKTLLCEYDKKTGVDFTKVITSGAQEGDAFKGFVKARPKPAKGQFERMARIPRNQLLDLLFAAFQEQERWQIKVLRERTQQPEAYLKEVLSEIATQSRSGEFAGTWGLKGEFRESQVEAYKVEPAMYTMAAKQEEDPDMGEDDDDDDDDDMVEVS